MSSEAPKKKILHIIDGFGAGGAETWLLATVKYLKLHPELGIQFDFLATGGERKIFDDEITLHGSCIYYKKYSFKNGLKFRKFFIDLLQKNNYQAIHDHQDFISGWHFLLGAGYLPEIRIAHLHNPYNFVHNYVVNPGRWFSFKMGRILTAILANRITGTSNAVMNEYGYGKWPFKSRRINPAYCGFDISKFRYNEISRDSVRTELGWTNSDHKICLFVGRIGLHDYDTALSQKNPEYAFSIARDLVSRNEHWRFIFVGFKGKLGSEMEKETRTTGFADKIKFLGLRNDVEAIMSASDIFIFPSLWEGLGMVAVKAQASGLPVIMSDTISKEAVICPELVTVKKLGEGYREWANTVLDLAEEKYDRPSYTYKVGMSSFSIENSITNLVKLYS